MRHPKLGSASGEARIFQARPFTLARHRSLVLVALAATALSFAPTARAQEALSIRPTVFIGGDDVDRGAFTTAAHLGVTGRTPELLPGLTLEAELSLLLLPSTAPHDASLTLADNSSYLRLHWKPASWSAREGLSFTVLPLHADRLYLGYEFPLADTLEVFGNSPVTGAELRLVRDRWYAFASVKSEMVENRQDHETHRAYTAFAGGGGDLFSALRIEVEGTHVDYSVNPEPQVLGQSVGAWGAAARVTYHHGSPIGPMTDYQQYRRDPAVWENLLRPEVYDDGLSASIAGEVLVLDQYGLASPDGSGATRSLPALGYAFDGRIKWKRTRFYLRAQARSISLIQSDAPGFPPFYAFSDDEHPSAEYGLLLAADHAFETTHLTPGLQAGVRRPAFVSPPASTFGLGANRTVVVTESNRFEIRADGQAAVPVYFAKLTLRWDLARFSAIGEAFYDHDSNRTTFAYDVVGASKPMWDDPSTFGFDVLVQARF